MTSIDDEPGLSSSLFDDFCWADSDDPGRAFDPKPPWVMQALWRLHLDLLLRSLNHVLAHDDTLPALVATEKVAGYAVASIWLSYMLPPDPAVTDTAEALHNLAYDASLGANDAAYYSRLGLYPGQQVLTALAEHHDWTLYQYQAKQRWLDLYHAPNDPWYGYAGTSTKDLSHIDQFSVFVLVPPDHPTAMLYVIADLQHGTHAPAWRVGFGQLEKPVANNPFLRQFITEGCQLGTRFYRPPLNPGDEYLLDGTLWHTGPSPKTY